MAKNICKTTLRMMRTFTSASFSVSNVCRMYARICVCMRVCMCFGVRVLVCQSIRVNICSTTKRVKTSRNEEEMGDGEHPPRKALPTYPVTPIPKTYTHTEARTHTCSFALAFNACVWRIVHLGRSLARSLVVSALFCFISVL